MWVAVLGVGRMGRALAKRLLVSDHTRTVWNRTSRKPDDVLVRGAQPRKLGRHPSACRGADPPCTPS
jgi:3-hydroxyisobutyrate dehydrogenase-like beta-hydroxyacid dehydrogenase